MSKVIRLKKLELINFRGYEKKEVEFTENYTHIEGTGGIGKTTIQVAFFFLLIGKDHNGMSEFRYFKPLDNKGNSLKPKEEYSVIGHFEITDTKTGNKESTVLQRILKETYVKRRGESVEEMTGHTNEYRINGVSYSRAKDYTEFVESLFGDEETICLCSNIFYFAEQLKGEPNKQRKILFDIIPHLSDKDIIENLKTGKYSDKQILIRYLETLINDGKALHIARQELKNKILELEKSKKEIPAKIKAIEGLRSKDVTDLLREDLLMKKDEMGEKINLLKEKIMNISKSTGEQKRKEIEQQLSDLDLKKRKFITDKTSSLLALKDEFLSKRKNLQDAKSVIVDRITDLRLEKEGNIALQKKDINNQIDLIQSNISIDNNSIAKLNYETSVYERDLSRLEKDKENTLLLIQELRDKATKILGRKFEFDDSSLIGKECPFCGTYISEEIAYNKKEKLRKLHESNIDEEINKINEKGIQETNKVSEIENRIGEIILKIDSNTKNVSSISLNVKDKEQNIKVLTHQKENIANTDKTIDNKLYTAQNNLLKNSEDIELVDSQIESNKNSIELVFSDEEYILIEKQIKDLQSELNKKDNDLITASIVEPMENELLELEEKKDEYTMSIFKIDRNKNIDEKVAEYNRTGIHISSDIFDNKNKVEVIEDFNKEKVASLDARIKEFFDYVSFDMYELQNNGELRETFNIVVDGKNFDKGLNSTAKTNAGIEITRTMQKHFGLYLPVFVDNIESVGEIRLLDNQMILLEMNRKETEELRISTFNNLEK